MYDFKIGTGWFQCYMHLEFVNRFCVRENGHVRQPSVNNLALYSRSIHPTLNKSKY